MVFQNSLNHVDMLMSNARCHGTHGLWGSFGHLRAGPGRAPEHDVIVRIPANTYVLARHHRKHRRHKIQ
jgi:hypothetical protein